MIQLDNRFRKKVFLEKESERRYKLIVEEDNDDTPYIRTKINPETGDPEWVDLFGGPMLSVGFSNIKYIERIPGGNYIVEFNENNVPDILRRK